VEWGQKQEGMTMKDLETFLDAILMASLIATDDPHAEWWDQVQFARDLRATCRIMRVAPPEATDFEDRPIIDALPIETLLPLPMVA
jgi:hypothetical protein